jgi:aspartate/methionine/tyrosine aminotransferase
MIKYIGAKAVPIPLKEESDWSLDVDELQNEYRQKPNWSLLTPRTIQQAA